MFILPMIIILQIEEFPYSFFADVVLINLIKKLNFLLIKDKYKCLPTSAFSFLIEFGIETVKMLFGENWRLDALLFAK